VIIGLVLFMEGLKLGLMPFGEIIGHTLGAIVYRARGIGPRERLGLLGIAVEAEKEVVSVLVATDHRDVVFEAIYRAAELDTLGAGFAYVTSLERMATYVPRQVLLRAQGQEPPT
jgi:nitrogen regulatory protein P-II 1